MNKIGNLGSLLQRVLNTQTNWRLKLIANWQAIIGSAHTKVRLEKIEGSTVVLAVSDAVWQQELYLLSDAIIEKMNTFLGARQVTTLKFKRAGIKTTIKKALQKNLPQTKHVPVTLSSGELRTLTSITDTELRSYLEAYLQRCKHY